MNQKLLHFLLICVYFGRTSGQEKIIHRIHKQPIHWSCHHLWLWLFLLLLLTQAHSWIIDDRHKGDISAFILTLCQFYEPQDFNWFHWPGKRWQRPPSPQTYSVYLSFFFIDLQLPYIGITNEMKLHHKKDQTLMCWLFEEDKKKIVCGRCSYNGPFIFFRLPTINNLIMEQTSYINNNNINHLEREKKKSHKQTHKEICAMLLKYTVCCGQNKGILFCAQAAWFISVCGGETMSGQKSLTTMNR